MSATACPHRNVTGTFDEAGRHLRNVCDDCGYMVSWQTETPVVSHSSGDAAGQVVGSAGRRTVVAAAPAEPTSHCECGKDAPYDGGAPGICECCTRCTTGGAS